MKAIKIVLGILFILGALGNLRYVGGMRSAELTGYMAATSLFFIIGVFLLYSGLKPKPPSLSISGDEEDQPRD
jgi:hypothetical protein